MTHLHALWLPIMISSVGIFVVSSVIHMLLPWHKNDYQKVPNEDKVREALRPLATPPGDYMVPRPTGSHEVQSPEYQQKLNEGPVLVLAVGPNRPVSMGRSLILWFIYLIVVGLFATYVTGRSLAPGAQFLSVFRLAGTTAFLGYSMALWQMSIWWRRSWNTTIKATIDGLIYGLVTAGFFGWLWPR